MSISKTMKLMTLTLFIASSLALGACNTMEGAGEDIEYAGDTIQDTAK